MGELAILYWCCPRWNRPQIHHLIRSPCRGWISQPPCQRPIGSRRRFAGALRRCGRHGRFGFVDCVRFDCRQISVASTVQDKWHPILASANYDYFRIRRFGQFQRSLDSAKSQIGITDPTCCDYFLEIADTLGFDFFPFFLQRFDIDAILVFFGKLLCP